MTVADRCKIVALLESLPEQVLASLRLHLSAAEWDVVQAARGHAQDVTSDERTAAIADFVLAMADRPASGRDAKQSLEQVDPAQLAATIITEHPQTIAVVLTQLPSARASEVFAQLPEQLRTDVAHRLATIDALAEDVIHEVKETVTARLAALPQPRLAVIDGVAALGEILHTLDRDTEQHLLTGLAQAEPEVAAAVARHTFLLTDILDWSTASAQLLLANIDTAPLAVTLKQLTSEQRRRILDFLPAPMAERLRNAIAHLGMVPKATIAQSQRTIIAALEQLQTSGKLRPGPLPSPNRRVA